MGWEHSLGEKVALNAVAIRRGDRVWMDVLEEAAAIHE